MDAEKERQMAANYAAAKTDRIAIAVTLLTAPALRPAMNKLAKQYQITPSEIDDIAFQFLQHRNVGEFKRCQGVWQSLRDMRSAFVHDYELKLVWENPNVKTRDSSSS